MVIKLLVWLEYGETIKTCQYDHITIVLIVFHISDSISTLHTKTSQIPTLFWQETHISTHLSNQITHTHAMQNIFRYIISLK